LLNVLRTALTAMVSSATTAVVLSLFLVGGSTRAQAPGLEAAPNPAILVYQQNGASVVNITSLAVVRTLLGSAQQQGIGSGFVLDDAGRIVTNNHVVEEAAELTVTFPGRVTVPARLLGRDPDNDLAVIQVDPTATDTDGRPIRDRLRPVILGDSDRVTIGETAIAIGSPLGLQQTVTQGIVSARRNPGEEPGAGQGQSLDLLGGAIQTDAAINPGNSGGPLFNARGEVIGVASAFLSQSGGNEGIGFAIPINVVKRVVPELIDSGRYRHATVGFSSVPLTDLSPLAKQQLGIAANQRGLLVQQVAPNAQQAGIQPGTRRMIVGGDVILAGGDIVVAVDDQPVVTGGDLRGWIENTKRPGDVARIRVLRGDQTVDLEVTLIERPQQVPPFGR
jgi:S1-C subfamily serine protease